MRVQDEAVYLLNNEKYLHLRENTSGVGYATYDKLTLLPLEKGQIPFEHLPPGTGSFLNYPMILAGLSSLKV